MKENSGKVTQNIKKERIVELLTSWEFLLVLIFIFVIVLNSILSPYFLDLQNILDNTFNFTEKAIIALSMMLVIICADIDISVASIIAIASVFMGYASEVHGAGTTILVVIGVVTGIIAGFINGIIITKLDIPAIGVTIGTMSLYRGIAYVILGDKAYTKYPKDFAFFGQGYIGSTGIPFEFVVFIVLTVVFGIILHRTTIGRKLYAIGNNSTGARFSGINVNRIRLWLFTLNGFLSGVASVFLTSRLGSTRPYIANGWELEIITTVVLGGVSIFGGKGNIFGVIVAIFLLGFLRFGMGLMNIPGTEMNIVIGFLLIVAIMLPNFMAGLRERYFKKI